MLKKKWISLLLVAGMCLSVVACQNKPVETPTTQKTEPYADVTYGEVPTPEPTETEETLPPTTETTALEETTTTAPVEGIGVPSRTVTQYRDGITFQIPEDWEMVGSTAKSILYTDPTHNIYLSTANITGVFNPFYAKGIGYDVTVGSYRRVTASYLMEIDGELRTGYRDILTDYDVIPDYYDPSNYETNMHPNCGTYFLSIEYKKDPGGSESETYTSLCFDFPSTEADNTRHKFNFTVKEGSLLEIYDLADAIVQSVHLIDPSEYAIQDLPTETYEVARTSEEGIRTPYFTFTRPACMTVDTTCTGGTRLADDTATCESLLDNVAILVIGEKEKLVAIDEEIIKKAAAMGSVMAPCGRVPGADWDWMYPNYYSSLDFIAGGEGLPIESNSGISLIGIKFNIEPYEENEDMGFDMPKTEPIFNSVFSTSSCTLILCTTEDGTMFGIVVITTERAESIRKQLVEQITASIQVVN